jgi:hypothetical protein
VRDALFSGGRSITLLEGSQATPARPDRNNVKLKTLGCQTDSEILNFRLPYNNLEKQVIWQHPQHGVIMMNLKSGGLHEKHAIATLNAGTISEFA